MPIEPTINKGLNCAKFHGRIHQSPTADSGPARRCIILSDFVIATEPSLVHCVTVPLQKIALSYIEWMAVLLCQGNSARVELPFHLCLMYML